MVPNNSATGGYLTPSSTQGLPGGLTLTQFIQSVLVGISGLSGTLVRPKFQPKPPVSPGDDVDWLNFGIKVNTPDANAYVWTNSDGTSDLQRQEALEISLGFYGPNSQDMASLVRDGFQIQQNLEALRIANMGFAEILPALRVPDLVNEIWVDRYETSLFLRRQIQRVYPVLAIASANGTIHTVLGDEEYLSNFETPEGP